MKEFVDEEKTQSKKVEVRPNPRFDRGDDETDKTTEEKENLSLGTIHMIGAQTTQILRIESGERSK